MAIEEDIDDDIDTILRYCGFAGVNNRISIAQDGFESFEDIAEVNDRISIAQDGFESFEDIMSLLHHS
jgi:hypothetical protein